MASPPRELTVYGYHGKRMQLSVPNLAVQGHSDDTRFTHGIGGELTTEICTTSFSI